MYVLGHTFNTQLSRQFTTLHCLSPLAYQVAEGYPEMSDHYLLRSFLSMSIALGMYTALCILIVIQIPINIWELFKAIMDTSFSSFSFYALWSAFAPTIIYRIRQF